MNRRGFLRSLVGCAAAALIAPIMPAPNSLPLLLQRLREEHRRAVLKLVLTPTPFMKSLRLHGRMT